MFLSDFSIKHPAIISICLIALLLFGGLSVMSLNQEMFPVIVLPELAVLTTYPGASVYDVEEKVTNILENEFSTVEGLSSISSSSMNSVSFIILELQEGRNSREMIPIVREAVNKIMADMPEELDGEPIIYELGAGAFLPVCSFIVRSDMDKALLTDILEDEVAPQIARLSGVSEINIQGSEKKVVNIYLKPEQLEAKKISATDVYQALRYNNVSVPAGEAIYRGTEMTLRTLGEFNSISEIEDMVIGFRDSAYIYLKDVAEAVLENKESDIVLRSQGEHVMVLNVLKRDEGNTMDIVRKTRDILQQTEEHYSNKIRFATISDQSDQTSRSLNTVVKSALLGVILAIIIIFLFLKNTRATFIIGISIPLSIVVSLILMRLMGQSINILTMSGMTVVIGMIVDGSIVVLENTYRHFDEGKPRSTAAALGADEVGSAILASTTTSICVFVPMLFLTGLIGIIMKDLSLTIVYALFGAMSVALIVVPYLSSKILVRQKRIISRRKDRSAKFTTLQRIYGSALSWSLEHKSFIIITAVTVLIISYFTLGLLEFSFLPATDTDELEIHVEVPYGFPKEKLQEKMDEIDTMVRHLVPELENAVYYVRSNSSMTLVASPNKGFGHVRVVPSKDRKRHIQEIIEQLQYELSTNITDVNITVLNGGFDTMVGYAAGGQGFKIEVYGNDLGNVNTSAAMVKALMEQDPDVYKVEISVSEDEQEMINTLSSAYMGGLGITPYETGLISRILFTGVTAGQFHAKNNTYDIILTSPFANGNVDDETLRGITLINTNGEPVGLDSYSNFSVQPAVSSISHNNKNISVNIQGYLKGEGQGGVTKRMTGKLNALAFPYGVSWKISGESELISSSLLSMIMVLLIAIFLVYMVMVIQFERFAQPLIIMAAVPFCLIGVVFGLVIFGSSLSIISMLGVVALSGIVVNNAIVMVDYINLLRRRDKKSLKDAVIEGCGLRLKPILMTTLTTLGGVIPMAFAVGNGSEMYAPLGQVIAGGLLTSTFITLFLVPVLYYLVEYRQEKKRIQREMDHHAEDQIPERSSQNESN